MDRSSRRDRGPRVPNDSAGHAALRAWVERHAAGGVVHYGLEATGEPLRALAQMVGEHAANLRGPDLKQAERMFSLLSAVLKSLPAAKRSALAKEMGLGHGSKKPSRSRRRA